MNHLAHRARMKLMGKRKRAPLGEGGRFKALSAKLGRRKGVTNPKALAAAIGRKKYGAKRMAAWSAKGRK